MAMSEQEKQAYLAEIGPRIEAAVDAGFMRLYGRTYRPDEVIPRPAPVSHAEKNGDSSHQPDTWQNITRDFPALFGPTDET